MFSFKIDLNFFKDPLECRKLSDKRLIKQFSTKNNKKNIKQHSAKVANNQFNIKCVRKFFHSSLGLNYLRALYMQLLLLLLLLNLRLKIPEGGVKN